jgi:hypothetical protein
MQDMTKGQTTLAPASSLQIDRTGEGLADFAGLLGTLVPRPWPHGTGFIGEVPGRTNNWHADMSPADACRASTMRQWPRTPPS